MENESLWIPSLNNSAPLFPRLGLYSILHNHMTQVHLVCLNVIPGMLCAELHLLLFHGHVTLACNITFLVNLLDYFMVKLSDDVRCTLLHTRQIKEETYALFLQFNVFVVEDWMEVMWLHMPAAKIM